FLEQARHFPLPPRRGRADACRPLRRHRVPRLGSDRRPCECHRSGSPANRGRRDPTPSTPSGVPPTVPRSAGRRPISTDQPPQAPERLLRATEPTGQTYLKTYFKCSAVVVPFRRWISSTTRARHSTWQARTALSFMRLFTSCALKITAQSARATCRG